MIPFWKRKELTITFSLEEQSRIRGVLAANKIEYAAKVRSMLGPTLFGGRRGRTGTLGLNMDVAYEYKIYVKREDFEYAFALIQGRIN